MNNLLSLGVVEPMNQALGELGLKLSDIVETEPEPGLGNGGLGRLAACYMDSLATLHLPAIGYGLRYEYGIFQQKIVDGWQVETTDKWLQYGNPWEIARRRAAWMSVSEATLRATRTRRANCGYVGFRIAWCRRHPVRYLDTRALYQYCELAAPVESRGA